jgi:hypothetical protein
MPSAMNPDARNAVMIDAQKRPLASEKKETAPSQPTIAKSGTKTSTLRMFA